MESSAQQKMQDTYSAATGTGWVTFAAIMFMISGVWHIIDGISALSKSRYLANQVLFANLEFWGVVALIIGGLCLYVGYALLNRSNTARIIGIALASLSMFMQFMFIGGNATWSLVIIAIDFMILYALIVKADETFSPAP